MDEDTIIATFCQKLKTLRLANGLTLEELGDMSGVSISTISKIENRQQKPSFETVLRVSRALHINFVQMLEPPTAPRHMARRSVTRAGDEPKLVGEHYTYATHAAEITNKAMVPSLMQIRTREVPPRDQWNTHQGEEFIFVLSGTLEFHTEEYTPVLLHKGDSCYLDSTMRHAFVAKGDEDVNILTIFMSPSMSAHKGITKDGFAAKDGVAANDGVAKDSAVKFGG